MDCQKRRNQHIFKNKLWILSGKHTAGGKNNAGDQSKGNNSNNLKKAAAPKKAAQAKKAATKKAEPPKKAAAKKSSAAKKGRQSQLVHGIAEVISLVKGNSIIAANTQNILFPINFLSPNKCCNNFCI